MLFDEYKKNLEFDVVEFEFTELNNSTMRLAEFISLVNAIVESDINSQALGKAWDNVENACNFAVKAYDILQNFKDLTPPQDIINKYERCLDKLPAIRGVRAQQILEMKEKVDGLIEDIVLLATKGAKAFSVTVSKSDVDIVEEDSDERADELLAKFEREFSKVIDSIDDYAGEYDRKTSAYKEFLQSVEKYKYEAGVYKIKVLTDKIEAFTNELVNTRCTDSFLSSAKDKLNELDSKARKLSSDYTYTSSGKYTNQLETLENARRRLKAEYSDALEDYQVAKRVERILNDSVILSLTEYDEIAAKKVKEARGLFNTIKREVHVKPELSSLLASTEDSIEQLRNEKYSEALVQKVNEAIDDLLDVNLSIHNFRDYQDQFETAENLYNGLSLDKQEQIEGYKQFKNKYKQLGVLEKKERTKQRSIERNAKVGSVLRDWASTLFILVILAGALVGIYFMMKSSWYFKAPEWCLHHSVKLWKWHSWSDNAFFGVTDKMLDAESLGWFWQLIFWLPCVIVDLVIAILQVVWWLVVLVSWPIRWVLSRIAGLILYLIAYALIAIVTAVSGYFIATLELTRKKYAICHAVNVVLAVVMCLITYLGVYLW